MNPVSQEKVEADLRDDVEGRTVSSAEAHKTLWGPGMNVARTGSREIPKTQASSSHEKSEPEIFASNSLDFFKTF